MSSLLGGDTPQSWNVLDVLGQRRILCISGFIVWMALFHFLVNVWLLCLFTSFLVVLGAWMGSQVILDSNHVLHLERFVTMDKLSSTKESEQLLDKEIENTVSKIIRDFVSSWYITVSSEQQFETEVHRAMIAMAMELKHRSKKVNTKALTQRVLHLFGAHLQSYMRVTESSGETQKRCEGTSDDHVWKLYSDENPPHPALKCPTAEVNYARAIVDLLLHVLVPVPHLETRTGRFVVGELITCNVLLPLIGKLSDPDWLNLMILEILNKSSGMPPPAPLLKTTSSLKSLLVETPPGSPALEALVPTPAPQVLDTADLPDGLCGLENSAEEVLADADVIEAMENCSQPDAEEDAFQLDEEFPAAFQDPILQRPMDFLRPGKSNPFYQEVDSDLDSPFTDLKKNSTESLVLISPMYDISDRPKEDALATIDAITDLEEDLEDFAALPDTPCPKVEVVIEARTSVSEVGRIEEPTTLCSLQELEEECPTSVEKTLLGLEAKQPGGLVVSPGDSSVAMPLQASSPSTALLPPGSFNFDPLSSPEGPVLIQNLRISGTITAKEHRGTGSHPYTLYTVKYETALDTDNPCAVQPVAYHMVNRRYSEFLNLQTRLEEKPELRKIIKNVKGPKKIFPDLPFGNMDSDKVEARKSLLENFLKQLCAIPETANSDEMQEFLALNTDARIAFVKKPFIVSRIDKIVMNAIVDTLKTAFPRSEPQSPTEDGDMDTDGKLSSDKKSKSRLRFSSKTPPVLIVTDIMPKVLYCFDEESTVFNGLSVTGLETFIEDQEALVAKATCSFLEPTSSAGDGGLRTRQGPDTKQPKAHSAAAVESPGVSEMALNLLCMLMREQWSWLCTENIQRTVKLLFGTLVDRWLEVKVCNLTCMEYWVTYLQLLQEAVWPGGRLPLHPRPQRSPKEREEARRHTLHCLMTTLPDLVSDLLGSEKYKLSWKTVLGSLQDPHINRHLVYSIWDLLLEFLIPEASEEAFQKSLLQSLSKNADKLLP